MKSYNGLKKIIFLLLAIILFNVGCAISLKSIKPIRDNFYDYNRISSELIRMDKDFHDIVDVEKIGGSYEGRSIYAVKITGNAPILDNKPALLSIFTQHGDEHDTTDLAFGIIKYLAENYGKDKRITDLLNQKEVWIIPMMNPDGVEYDLSGGIEPFSWRKNRRPIEKEIYGVDLNRNWGYKWDAPVPKELARQLQYPNDIYYHGDKPFSEYETQAVRDFLLSHKNIRIFIDYHSGYAGFIQGGIGFPFAYSEKDELIPEHKKRYEEISQKYTELVTDPDDSRNGYIVSQARDVKKNIKKYSPFYLKPIISLFLPESTIAPGGSADWAYGELGIMAFGVEIFRDKVFFNRLPESKNKLIDNQLRGFLFFLETLSDDIFKNNYEKF